MKNMAMACSYFECFVDMIEYTHTIICAVICVLAFGSCTIAEYQNSDAIRHLDGRIYLRMSCITEWNSCHAYSIDAYTKTWWGKKKDAYIFEYVPELAIFPDKEARDGKLSSVGVEIYGITPEILFDEWAESFFFDHTKEDLYLPVFAVPKDLSEIHLIDNSTWKPTFYHYHWNGIYFEYKGVVEISLHSK